MMLKSTMLLVLGSSLLQLFTSGTPVIETTEVDDNMNIEKLTKQYSQFPYPEVFTTTKIKSVYSSDLATVSYSCFSGRWSSVWKSPTLRILNAGGGTGDATLHLASQLRSIGVSTEQWDSPPIVHLDLSPTSVEMARSRAVHQGLAGLIDFRVGSLLDEGVMGSLGRGEEGFDFILAHGVLHHLVSPEKGLDSLRNSLRPRGCVGIMVYGKLGRTGIYDVQEMMRLLDSKDDSSKDDSSKDDSSSFEDEEAKVTLLRSLLSSLPSTSRLRRNEKFWGNVLGEVSSGAGAYDLFLHSQDRSYTVDDIFDWAQGQCGMRIVAFNERGLYDPSLWIDSSETDSSDPIADSDEDEDEDEDSEELKARLRSLDWRGRASLAELLHGAIQRHSFYLTADSDEDPARHMTPRVAPNTIPCAPRGGKVEIGAYEVITSYQNNHTVDISRNVDYASSVFPKDMKVRYEGVSELIQFPWVYGERAKRASLVTEECEAPCEFLYMATSTTQLN